MTIKKFPRYFILFFIFFLSSINFTAQAENSHKPVILIIGDSLSAAYGIDIQKSWPVLLQKKLASQHLSYQVINASISGSTTSNGLAILPAVLEKYKPAVTIIALGGNDGLRGLQLNIIRNNLQKMISVSKKQGKVLLLGVRLPPNYGVVYTQQFSAIFRELAKQNAVTLVPLFLSGVDDKPALMQSDGIHPAAQAQPVLLENLWPALEKLLIKT
jgi:acyl-CoA thioesterase-1